MSFLCKSDSKVIANLLYFKNCYDIMTIEGICDFMENKKALKEKITNVRAKVLAAIAMFGCGMVLSGYVVSGYVFDQGLEVVKLFKNTNNKIVDNNTIVRGVEYDRLKDFVETASIYNPSFNSLITELSRETFGLTERQRVTLAYQAVIGDIVKVTEKTLPEKYEDERDYFIGEGEKGVYELDFTDFNDKYAYFFGRSISYDRLAQFAYGGAEAVGCPVIYKVDKELGKIYFSNYCANEAVADRYITKVYDYDYDDNFYYVYEYIAKYGDVDGYYRASNYEEVEVDEFDGNERKFDTLIWKFDKDYNFVSTTYKG